MRFTAVLALLGALAGCAAEAGDDDALAASTAEDITSVARTAEAIDEARLGAASGSFDGVGTCVWDWTLVGTTFDAAPASVPCGGTLTGERGGTFTYEVTGGALFGEAVPGAGDGLDYDLAGHRDAALHTTSSRGIERDFDATWTVLSLTGTAEGDGVAGPFVLAAAYDGWAGGAWAVTVEADGAGALTGTAEGPRGRSCTVTGSVDAVEVTCDPE